MADTNTMPENALHWAAVAYGLKEAGDAPLSDRDLAAYEGYQQAAYAHGYTPADVRGHHAHMHDSFD